MNQRILSAMTAVLLSAATCAWADPIDDYVNAEMAKRHIPALSLAIVQDGNVMLAKGYGLANVELSVPAAAETVYELGSITKQFTATAIMMLVEDGKICLDDPIAKYVSDAPSAWNDITVRHLLNHTSGIKSYTSVPGHFKVMRNDRTKEEVIGTITEFPLEFSPGEKWAYSNTGYFLLGMIIEKASGQSYDEFLAERIFQPLEMTTTCVNDMRRVIKNRAAGYTWQDNELRNGDYASMTWPYAAGAIVSTVLDLAKWDRALYTERLLKRSSLDQMWTPTQLASGATQDYGFGWGLGSYRGHKIVGHGGGIPGFSTDITRFVGHQLTVIVLCNSDRGNPGSLARSVAALYLPALAQSVEQPVEDKDPTATELVKNVLLSTPEDKVDPELFTAEARAELFPDRVKQAGEFIRSLGEMKSFTLVERKEEGKNQVSRYRVVFGDKTLVCRCTLTEEGKIAELTLRDE